MSLLTDAELEAIRERCDATPHAPWSWASDYEGWAIQWANLTDSSGETLIECEFELPSIEVRKFVAHARTDIPRLLAHIAALTEQLDIAKRNAEQVALLVREANEKE